MKKVFAVTINVTTEVDTQAEVIKSLPFLSENPEGALNQACLIWGKDRVKSNPVEAPAYMYAEYIKREIEKIKALADHVVSLDILHPDQVEQASYALADAIKCFE